MKNMSRGLKIALALLLLIGVAAGGVSLLMPRASQHDAACDSVMQVLPGKVAHIHPLPNGIDSAVLCRYDGMTPGTFKQSSLEISQPSKLAHLINQSAINPEPTSCLVASLVNFLIVLRLESGKVVPFDPGFCGPASSPYSSHYFDLSKAAIARITELEKRLNG
jgi:hypothetical protein